MDASTPTGSEFEEGRAPRRAGPVVRDDDRVPQAGATGLRSGKASCVTATSTAVRRRPRSRWCLPRRRRRSRRDRQFDSRPAPCRDRACLGRRDPIVTVACAPAASAPMAITVPEVGCNRPRSRRRSECDVPAACPRRSRLPPRSARCSSPSARRSTSCRATVPAGGLVSARSVQGRRRRRRGRIVRAAGSVVSLETEAVLVTLPAWSAVTVIATVACAPEARAPRLQVIVSFRSNRPATHSPPRSSPSGKGSVTVTPVAVLGRCSLRSGRSRATDRPAPGPVSGLRQRDVGDSVHRRRRRRGIVRGVRIGRRRGRQKPNS